jgi:hypothetical protein
MDSPFDIFRVEPDGTLVWQGTAATPEEAEARVHDLGVNAPGKYVVASIRDGVQITIHSNGTDHGLIRAKSATES